MSIFRRALTHPELAPTRHSNRSKALHRLVGLTWQACRLGSTEIARLYESRRTDRRLLCRNESVQPFQAGFVSLD